MKNRYHKADQTMDIMFYINMHAICESITLQKRILVIQNQPLPNASCRNLGQLTTVPISTISKINMK